MPGWLWVVFILAALLFIAVRSFYARFRGVCRRTREELQDLLRRDYPGVEVLREERGDLVVRSGNQEQVWEMADLYSAVAQLPGMGQDPQARQRLYQHAARTMFAPKSDEPLDRERHGALIKPQLLPPDGSEEVPVDLIRSPEVPGLGLKLGYVVDAPGGPRYLTEQDRLNLGIKPSELHDLAVANLAKGFPHDLLSQPLTANSGSAIQFSDGFDAARLLLLPGHLQAGEAVLALVPHRDMLMLLPEAMQDDPGSFRQVLQLLACDGHPPLLRQPVRVTSAGFQLLG